MSESAVAVFPVSFAQQRLWFLAQLEPDSALYNVPQAFDVPASLDRHSLAWCLNEIVRRHEALRTTFVALDGAPVQVVAPSLEVSLPEVDLRRSPPEARAEALAALASDQYGQPFDLEHGPLLRALLVRWSDEESRLLVTMHHIVSDGWSLEVFGRELRVLAGARAAGTAATLPALPVQYGDFAVWQRDRLTGDVLRAELDYWTTRLRDAPAVLRLPADRPRPTVQSYRGASQQIRLSAATSDRVRALAQQEGVTVFMYLLAAFGVLVHRFTNREDFVVGTPVAGRTQVETEPLIGCFVNALALRLTVVEHATFRTFLSQVKELALDAYAHQELPFEKLVDALQPARSLSYHPVFQVMFQVLAGTPGLAADFADTPAGDVSDDTLDVDEGTSKFDLSMDVIDLADGFVAGIEYSTDLFDHATVQRMLSSFVTVVEDVVDDPDRLVANIAILSPRERALALHAWNPSGAETPLPLLAHQLFERQAATAPERIAVDSAGSHLTYGELDRRANQLAHRLRRAGAGPEQVVGILVDRSPEMIVGVLGILKAGAAYLPLDASSPRQRLEMVLLDAGVRTLVTQTRWLDALPAVSLDTLCLDDAAAELALEPSTAPPAAVTGEHLAYVIYTSGSTGRPKGVMIEHRSLARWIPAAIERYGLRADDRILQFASLSFDTSIEEIFTCLALGATLQLRTDVMGSSVDEFLRRCDGWHVTVADLPTAFWHELAWAVSSRALSIPRALRLVIVGGERVIPSRVAMWHRAKTSHVQLMQGYGPTESTIVATIADLTPLRDETVLPEEVPIGHVVPPTRAYVLDRHGHPTPTGVAGELYLGGDLLARGYLGRPDLTAERFLPDPFSDRPGARLYRTGDLVRRRLDGQLEFLGRSDDQVKVRGYRVELAEIEAALKDCPGVRAAVVSVFEGQQDHKELAAFVVVDRPEAFVVSSLRESLRDRLPAYMIPASFTRLDALPLTPTGKLDRRALPTQRADAVDADDITIVPPRNETERVIASIWTEVFQNTRLGVHANFFDLGGNSLTLVRVRSRLRDAFGDEISMVDMFRYPTIGTLAEHVDQSRASAAGEPVAAAPDLQDRAARQAEAYGRWTRAASTGRGR